MNQLQTAVTEIMRRAVPGGGFCLYEGGGEQPDATAWACLLMAATGRDAALVEAGCDWLRAHQSGDGRVSVDALHGQALWPTALAVLAWHAVPRYAVQRDRAGAFLLSIAGDHWKRTPDSPLGHDTNLLGWSWTENAHAWVEPTAMAVIALRTIGLGQHSRVREGLVLLLDRQLPRAGWNYGNTTVFGTALRPNVESTGLVLHAIAGLAAPHDVERSIRYLREEIHQVTSPIALGWALLGLQAWGILVPEGEQLVARALARQERRGPYDTSALSVVLLPLFRQAPLWA